MFLFAAFFAATAAADEGMWLLPYLQKMNIADMRAKGCELSAEEIYAADRSSLKDAIVIFGAGWTGEEVSPEGISSSVVVTASVMCETTFKSRCSESAGIAGQSLMFGPMRSSCSGSALP